MDVTPATATVAVEATRQFAATEFLSDGSSRAATGVTWTATGGTVSGTGLYTAGSSAGSYRVIGTKGSFADTAAVTITTAPPPGGSLAWFDDFRVSLTSKGLAHIAWNAPINRIPVSSATGIWPSGLTHVAENVYVGAMNAAYQAVNLWPSPAIGEYLFGRMLLNNSLPAGANTGGDHGFQTNIFSPLSWFWRIWGGDANSFTLESTTWDDNSNGSPLQLQVDAPKDVVLRLEWRVQRTGTSSAVYSARVYNNQTGVLLGQVTGLPRSGASGSGNHFRDYLFGMSGQLGASFNGGSVYWGAVAIRVSSNANDWIGPYPVPGVEQP
jgi:hypothetical protein